MLVFSVPEAVSRDIAENKSSDDYIYLARINAALLSLFLPEQLKLLECMHLAGNSAHSSLHCIVRQERVDKKSPVRVINPGLIRERSCFLYLLLFISIQ